MFDLIIVGAGPAGLSLAYYLRDSGLDIQILESDATIGGRAKSSALAGAAVNTGAMFVYRDTPAEELALELKQKLRPFVPSSYGIHYEGRTSVAPSLDQLAAGLPLNDVYRAELKNFLNELVAEYRENTKDGAITGKAEQLEHLTVAERIQHLSTLVRGIVEAAVRGGAVGSSEHLSAKYALRYLASYIAHESKNRLYPQDGMQALLQSMREKLPATTRLRTDTRVESVRRGDAGVEVRVAGSKEPLKARQVALAVPSPVVAGIVEDLPDWKMAALDHAPTPGSCTLGIAVDVRGAEEYAEWSFVTTVGKSFDAVINPTPGLVTDDGLVRFTCYGNTNGYIADFEKNPEHVERWIRDFKEVAPGLANRIVGVQPAAWEHCFASLSPQREAHLDDLQRSVGPIHFLGDYTSASAGTHGAYGEGRRVARLVATNGLGVGLGLNDDLA